MHRQPSPPEPFARLGLEPPILRALAKIGFQEPTEIQKYRPKINARLAGAISACLKVDPEERPESMEQFLSLIKGLEREDDE